MLQIGKIIVSRDLFEHRFVCRLDACEGNCCVHGDSGAPLEMEEAALLDREIGQIVPYMRKEGVVAIHRQGNWVIDEDGDRVTPLLNRREECAYVWFDGDIASCAIEKAWEAGKTGFRKPLSCHLYPIRISRLSDGIALNIHQWSVCAPARELGKELGVPVFRFLKEAIQRAFGEQFYTELEEVYAAMAEERLK
ncbi:MAG: DUF3109 family protein [Bacteroidota bacterium]